MIGAITLAVLIGFGVMLLIVIGCAGLRAIIREIDKGASHADEDAEWYAKHGGQTRLP